MGYSRTKHFDTKLKLCQEVEETGIVTYQRVDTEDNVADVLTKPLARDRHRKLMKEFGLEVSWPRNKLKDARKLTAEMKAGSTVHAGDQLRLF